MPVQRQTITTYTDWMKEKWLPDAGIAFNQDTVMLKNLQRGEPQVVSGRSYLYPIQKTRNWGSGPRHSATGSTNGYLPSPGRSGVEQISLTRKNYHSGFQLDGAVIDACVSAGAVTEPMVKEMNQAVRIMKSDVNVDLFGDGTGILATASLGAGGNNITTTTGVSTLYVNHPASSGTPAKYRMQYLSEGQPIVIANQSTGAVLANGELYAGNFSLTNGTITLYSDEDLAVTATVTFTTSAIGYAIYRQGAHGSTSASARGNSLSGLRLAVSDIGTYGGINRASAGNAWFKSGAHSANGQTTGPGYIDFLTAVANQCDTRAGGKVSLWVFHELGWRFYARCMYGNQVWNDKVVTLDGGFKALEFNGAMVVWDKDCPPTMGFALDMSTLELLVERDFSPRETDGQLLQTIGTGATAEDAYEARFLWRGELGCNNPAANAYIYDIPVGSVAA